MVPRGILASSHEGAGDVEGRFPLDEANDLSDSLLRGDGEEHMHVIRHHMALFNPTFLLLG